MSGINNSHYKVLPTRKDPIAQRSLIERAMDKDYIIRHEQMKILAMPGYISRWKTSKS